MESLKFGDGPISVGVPLQPQLPQSETSTACRANASRTLGRKARMGDCPQGYHAARESG